MNLFSGFLKSLLSDVDNQVSSKRLVLLYIALPVWSFVHYFVFAKPEDIQLKATLMQYDFFLIVALAGVVLSEKFTDRGLQNKG